MNILCVSYWDNGGQLQLLAEAIRKYTKHDAIHLNIQATYLDYEKDFYYPDFKQSPMGILELKEKLSSYDDFFIFSELLPDDEPLRAVLEELGIYHKLTCRNVIIRTGGSIPRNNPEHYLFAQLKKGYIYAGAAHDFSIASQIGFVAPTRNICPIDKIPKPNPPTDKIRVAFAPTKQEKGVNEFARVMDNLTADFHEKDVIEAVHIMNKPWRESIKIKSECNVTFDQFMISTYANSAIESMYLSHAVLSRIDSYTKMLFPDLPVINVSTERDLYMQLKWLIENPEELKERGEKGKKFVEKYHSPEVVAKQWEGLIEHVKEA